MMLDRMRRGAARVVGTIFAALLIVAMAAWGIGDYIRGGPQNGAVATVGGSEITTREFDRAFRNAIDRLRRTLGPTFDVARARQLGMPEGTLDGLIDQRLITLQAKRLGLLVGDEVLEQQTRRNAAFNGPAGQFDYAMFRQALSGANMSEAEYFSVFRSQMLRDYVTGSVSSGGFSPSSLANEMLRYQAQRRTAEVIIVPRGSAGDVGKPGDAEILAFHTKHTPLFTAPEYRKITAIVLDPEEYAAEIEPDEKAIRAEYEHRLPTLEVPEGRELQQILFTDEAKAKKAAELLRQGRDFAKVAEKIAGKNKDELSLGAMTKQQLGALGPKLSDAVFAVKENQTTEPLRSALGWHIIKVLKIHPGNAPAFKDLRKKIGKELAHEKAVDQLVEIANKLEDALAGGATLEEAAQTIGAKVLSPSAVDRQGRPQDGKKTEKLPTDPKFLQVAFEIPASETSQLEETGNAGFFILRVDRIVAPALRPLDKVRDKVIAAWKRVRQDRAIVKRTKEILDKINGGTPLSQAAAEAKLKTFISKPVNRRGEGDETFPRALLEELFRLKPGRAAMARSGAGYGIVQLKKIEEPDDKVKKAQLKQLQAVLDQAIGNDLLVQFSSALKKRYAVSIDQTVLTDYLDRQTGNVP